MVIPTFGIKEVWKTQHLKNVGCFLTTIEWWKMRNWDQLFPSINRLCLINEHKTLHLIWLCRHFWHCDSHYTLSHDIWNKIVWIYSVTLRSSEQEGMATTHLHWGPLHSRHTGKTVEDGETDRNSDKETANEGPQVTSAWPHLLSHHLDGQQGGKKETFVQH